MAKRRPLPPRKRRTREHVLADLSVNHVERQALLCGFSVFRLYPDYGYDLLVHTFAENGEVEPGELLFQLKATERLRQKRSEAMFPFAVEMSDLRRWKHEVMPVILILFEAENDRAYWVHIQEYLSQQVTYSVDWAQRTLTVLVPRQNVVNDQTFLHFRDLKTRICEEWEAENDH